MSSGLFLDRTRPPRLLMRHPLHDEYSGVVRTHQHLKQKLDLLLWLVQYCRCEDLEILIYVVVILIGRNDAVGVPGSEDDGTGGVGVTAAKAKIGFTLGDTTGGGGGSGDTGGIGGDGYIGVGGAADENAGGGGGSYGTGAAGDVAAATPGNAGDKGSGGGGCKNDGGGGAGGPGHCIIFWSEK